MKNLIITLRNLCLFCYALPVSATQVSSQEIALATSAYGKFLKKVGQKCSSYKTRDSFYRLTDSLAAIADTVFATRDGTVDPSQLPTASNSAEKFASHSFKHRPQQTYPQETANAAVQFVANISNHIIETSISAALKEIKNHPQWVLRCIETVFSFVESVFTSICQFFANLFGSTTPVTPTSRAEASRSKIDSIKMYTDDLGILINRYVQPYNTSQERRLMMLQISSLSDELVAINDQPKTAFSVWTDLCMKQLDTLIRSLASDLLKQQMNEDKQRILLRVLEITQLLGYQISNPYEEVDVQQDGSRLYRYDMKRTRIYVPSSPSMDHAIAVCVAAIKPLVHTRTTSYLPICWSSNQDAFIQALQTPQIRQSVIKDLFELAPVIIKTATDAAQESIKILANYTAQLERDRFSNGDRAAPSPFIDAVVKLAPLFSSSTRSSSPTTIRDTILDNKAECDQIFKELSFSVCEIIKFQLLATLPKVNNLRD